jgi:hypothetical protein
MSDNTASAEKTGDIVSKGKGAAEVDTKDVSMDEDSSSEEEIDEVRSHSLYH